MKHETREGKEIELKDMTDEHLINTMRYLKRVARKGIFVRRGICDFDGIEYDEEILTGTKALSYLGYYEYKKELKRRKISE